VFDVVFLCGHGQPPSAAAALWQAEGRAAVLQPGANTFDHEPCACATGIASKWPFNTVLLFDENSSLPAEGHQDGQRQ
jgi:hypothetical protein